jgi:hypothetical protein
MKLAQLCCALVFGTFAACSDDAASTTTSSDAQTPPTTGGADLEKWIKDGSYLTWTCEPAKHAPRSPSPHPSATGFNRICSNDVVKAAATGTGAWPKGSAAVKELFSSDTSTTPDGYAVYLKTDADSASGANWYWYERVGATVVADGKGGSGAPRDICVACHGAAGSDAPHTPTTGGRDQVYTPVH